MHWIILKKGLETINLAELHYFTPDNLQYTSTATYVIQQTIYMKK